MPGGNYESILSQRKNPMGKIEKGPTNRSEARSTLNKSNGLSHQEESQIRRQASTLAQKLTGESPHLRISQVVGDDRS
jgi:hypothetical protein